MYLCHRKCSSSLFPLFTFPPTYFKDQRIKLVIHNFLVGQIRRRDLFLDTLVPDIFEMEHVSPYIHQVLDTSSNASCVKCWRTILAQIADLEIFKKGVLHVLGQITGYPQSGFWFSKPKNY